VGDGTAGSGTLVARSENGGLVLTCSHLFDGSSSNIVVTFASGQRFSARLVERDRANDLAALVIARPDAAEVALSDSEPTGSLTACGFGPNGSFQCVRGPVVGMATAVGATHPSWTIRGAVRPGDSGGGVLDEAGRLVGVVWGQRDGLTYATCGRPVRDLLNRLVGKNDKAQLPTVTDPKGSFDWQAWKADVDARLQSLDAAKQGKGDYVLRDELPDLSPYARREELNGGLKNVSGRFESILSRVESVHERLESIGQTGGGVFGGLSTGKLIVGALGLSGPVAVALMVASGVFALRRKKRGMAAASVSPAGRSPPVVAPITVDSPPPPQRAVPETHYVSYETDSFAKAHQWASEQVARKYPGAAEILQAQDSMIKQYMAAK
jgi:hypothetical protein